MHECLADHYRQDRVFLVGDAAHVHSPAGGQGMNTGIQDAYNLVWKLALVINNQANPTILHNYEQERRPVAQTVLKNSTSMTHMVSMENGLLIRLRNFFMGMTIGRCKTLQNKTVNLLTELSYHYRDSAIVENHSNGNIQAGDRVPVIVKGTKHVLVLFENNAEEAKQLISEHYTDLIDIETNRSKFDVLGLKQGYCLIRPDQYVGFVGESVEQLTRYLETNY